ncbi:GDT1-like protein 2, chloroplastic [Gracilariopsis chorda]|uniref:GDT1 family protein n=1 Tax=Gracilariopsis chorda TaxID=448386 RepID=A0A2V3J2L5_9FLOR|nr:GDT1-like protein 2, chloroplastic [Gracilariopsis chorda]|eukprot:PXF48619.1 GDT1-like protein 2, chloroplastic [Gracilariopsis chorda]
MHFSSQSTAFVRAGVAPLTARSAWTGRSLTQRPPSVTLVVHPVSIRAQTGFGSSSFRRRLLQQRQAESQPISVHVTQPSFTRPALPSCVLTPARRTLAFAARAARTIARLRRRHAFTLKLARMGGILAVALVSYVVTRGAMTPPSATIATVSAPALPIPPFPFKARLPERISSFVKPFTESFGMVFLSEFGDKSMFATALMAMKHNAFLVCVGAFAALTVMTFVACFLGQLMQYLPATVTHYSSIALFVFFGLQMIMQSRNLPNTPGGVGGERADAEEMVAQATVAKIQNPLAVLTKVSSLIFVAEWCDRSMVATMALAASNNVVAVIGGATLANVVCTGMAVGAATLVASRISERMVALVAGILFEFFAVFTYLEGPEG